jgi:tetratricopeptide (TPR) repeat protein
VLEPDLPEALFNLGGVLQSKGELDEAAGCLLRVLELLPENSDVLVRLGGIRLAQGERDEALDFYQRVLKTRPDDPEVLNAVGNILWQQNKPEEALACYRAALARRPDFPHALNNLGIALVALGQTGDALAHLRRAIELAPDYHEARYNLGYGLQMHGDLDDALECYDQVLQASPDLGEALWGRALTRLAKGDYARGWQDYEARYTARIEKPVAARPDLACPMWRGEPLAGKRLLLVREQGFGDQIQFVRYAGQFAQQAAAVDVMVDAPLARLFRSVPGVREAVTDVASDSGAYDYWSLMLSAPLRAGTVLETVPRQVPYMHAPEEAVRKWAAKLAALPKNHLKVGLIWAGSAGYGLNRFRSMPFSTLAPLANVRNVSYVSLQTGERELETRDAAAGFPALLAGREMGDFADTAALIVNLDLLIAVDTAFAHLAGALGRPVWLLQAAMPDWRWMRDRDDSPWYPTLRLMRQARLGDWAPVVARVARELGNLRGQA